MFRARNFAFDGAKERDSARFVARRLGTLTKIAISQLAAQRRFIARLRSTNLLKEVARLTGVEPATLCSGGTRSIQLSYRRAVTSCGIQSRTAAYQRQALRRRCSAAVGRREGLLKNSDDAAGAISVQSGASSGTPRCDPQLGIRAAREHFCRANQCRRNGSQPWRDESVQRKS
jgi:hypothetical protein